jgi:hypothetical protein
MNFQGRVLIAAPPHRFARAKAALWVVGIAALLALCATVLVAPAPAGAKETRLPRPPVGSFTQPTGLAFDQGAGDVYAVDGRSEVQQIKISATAWGLKQ